MAIKIILIIILAALLIGSAIWFGALIYSESKSKILKIVSFIIASLSLALLIILPWSIHEVKTGEVAVVRGYGVVKEYKTPGVYFQDWIKYKYEKYDTKVQQLEIETPAYSSDGQTLDLKVDIQYDIKVDKVTLIATEYGDLAKLESRIQTVSIERIKSVISQKSAMDIIGTRNEISANITKVIGEAIDKNYYINIRSVSLTNVDFTDEFEKIIEDKVAAEQEAQKAINEAAKKQTEAEAAKKVAELEADAALYNAKKDELRDDSKIVAQELKNAKVGEKAKKEAEAILLKAQAEADALKIEKQAVADSIDVLIQNLGLTTEEAVKLYEYLIWIGAWDGDVPTVVGNDKGYVVTPGN